MNIKNVFIIFIAMLLAPMLVSATPTPGLMDDAYTLDNNQFQMGFVFGSQSILQQTVYLSSYPFQPMMSSGIIPSPFLMSYGMGYYSYYYGYSAMVSVPNMYIGFASRWGTKNRGEISLGVGLVSPKLHMYGVYENMFGPGLYVEFGTKKNIFRNDKFNLSYKFNLMLFYNAKPGVELIMKNGLMLGTNRENRNFTFIMYLENMVGWNGLLFMSMFSPPMMVPATITPGMEWNWSRTSQSGFTYTFGMFLKYQTTIDLNMLSITGSYGYGYYGFYYSGSIEMGLSFGFQGRSMKLKKRSRS